MGHPLLREPRTRSFCNAGLIDRLVSLVFPLALLPIVLESAHFGAFIGPLGILERVLETALLALCDEEENEPGEQGGANASGPDVYTGLGPGREFGPLLGQRFWWVLDGIGDGGVAPVYLLACIFVKNSGGITYAMTSMLCQDPE